MIYPIVYDLEDHYRPAAYAKVMRIIYENSISVHKLMYSAFAVETLLKPDDWVGLLSPIFDQEDNFFICEIHRPYQGWVASEEWDWLCEKSL